MNKKIKVIELFKRIEKHEDIPKNIKYEDNCYTFKHTNYSIDHLYELKESYIGWLEHKDINLFDEVEILEDNTEEIEELKEKNENLLDALNNSIDIKKYWVNKDKIKAKIEEIDEVLKGQLIEKIRVYFEAQKEVLQSLLQEEENEFTRTSKTNYK